MAIHQAFLGHGIFTEFSIKPVLARFKTYASPNPTHPAPRDEIDRFIFALKDMDIRSVWIQLFSRGGDFDSKNAKLRQDLIARLGTAGIHWAGWGYCAGRNWKKDIDLIKSLRADLGMQAFVIDAEPGNTVWPDPQDKTKRLPDLWELDDFDDFTKAVHKLFGTDNLALSTWPVLKIQDDEKKQNPVIKLMRIAAPRVCLFAPQAYWMTFPKQVHYNLGYKEKDFPRDNPASYVRLVIRSWRDLKFTNPLVISGQAYWGENSPAQKKMEAKAAQFINEFADWPEIVGFNWYHAGSKNSAEEGSMSDAMIASIAAGKLADKPYQAPAAQEGPAPVVAGRRRRARKRHVARVTPSAAAGGSAAHSRARSPSGRHR